MEGSCGSKFEWGNVVSSSKGGKIPIYAQVIAAVYEKRVENLISMCTHLRAAGDLSSTYGIICIWLDVMPEGRGGRPPAFEPLARFFGIWHEHSRGVHKGMHEFYYGKDARRYILILNTFDSGRDSSSRTSENQGMRNYRHLKPAGARLLKPTEFTLDLRHALEQEQNVEHLRANEIKVVGASTAGLSCNEVCASLKDESKPGRMVCHELSLSYINSCSALQSVFSCSGGCSESLGSEQPAMVTNVVAGQGHKPGLCLFSSNAAASTCDASHKYTQRVCPCKKCRVYTKYYTYFK